MNAPLIVAVDIGSSSCKVGLFDPEGRCLALERGVTPVTSEESREGRREYDPTAWWTAVRGAIRALLSRPGVTADRIAAVGLTGQIGTHLVLTGSGKPVRSAISWQDGRAWKETAELAERFPGSSLDELIGMHLPPGAAWPIPRLLWMRRNEPDSLAPGNRWLQPKDYILYSLTGRFVTDVLSLRGLMHPHTRRIHPGVKQDLLGMPSLEALLPEAASPTDIAGTVSRAASDATGIPEGTPVVAGCGDFHCALLGTGITDGSCGFNITGTSDHIGVLVPRSDPGPYPEVLGRYPSAVEGQDILYGATSSSGGMVEWFLRTFAPGAPEPAGELVERLAGKEQYANGIVCLPYLNGERAPIWDTNARGAFIGMGGGHTVSHFMLAVLEGVAFSLRHSQDLMDAAGRKPALVRVSGAGARNPRWNRIKAGVLGRPVVEMESAEVTCLGAAVLAAAAIGLYGDTDRAARAMTRTAGTVEPDRAGSGYYGDMFEIYRKSYLDLKDRFTDLAAVREGLAWKG